MPEITTVGVYGSSLEEFLAELERLRVRTVFDIRQRRGVRGSDYAWANSRRLQRALEQAGVSYQHHKELAPTTELRNVQYAADARHGVGKRARRHLDPEYRRRYTSEVLDRVDLAAVIEAMPTAGTTALLCVEADAAACHRSIVAERLAGAGMGVRLTESHAPLPPNAAPWPAAHVPTRFERDVIDALRATVPGDLITYGDLATEVGRPGAGQAVANVLRRVSDLPWWRVVPAEGRLYRSHAPVQQPLLEHEGHRVDVNRRVHIVDG